MAAQGVVAHAVSGLEVFPAAVLVLSGGGRASSARKAVACDTAVRDVSARAPAEQGMFALAVALREVFPAVWTAHEALARAEAAQETLSQAVPLQEGLACVLIVRKVLMHAVDGWDVFPATIATTETIVSADRGARGVHAGRQGPCTYTIASMVPSRGISRRLCGKTSCLYAVEGRWGRMDAATTASER